ncbi:LAME_0H09406g1_1 [Lachancea meyersii CBS 8951]|uniref:LAME_0H09406g1_1 n=1 Tax=Lachancea meyersii CBS 8951 TaxID=1266667 RepID=A0A1G4KFG9_9SACH|nr:LAME_0H09406g1_1 [Lachancea meyersii CBS 8951]
MTLSVNFLTSEDKYDAIKDRNPKAEGVFVYAVKTTGVVCRPTCSARLALFKNILFFATLQEAIELGFRPCRKCKPEIQMGWNRHRKLVIALIALFHEMQATGRSAGDLKLAEIAKSVHISKWQLIKVFKRYTGTTPMKYFQGILDGKKPLRENDIPNVVTKKRELGPKTEEKSTDGGESSVHLSVYFEGILDDDWVTEFYGR